MVKRNEKLKEKIAKERGEKKDDKEDLPDFVGEKEQGKATGNGAASGPSMDLGR